MLSRRCAYKRRGAVFRLGSSVLPELPDKPLAKPWGSQAKEKGAWCALLNQPNHYWAR